jgi:hypothetical protein
MFAIVLLLVSADPGFVVTARPNGFVVTEQKAAAACTCPKGGDCQCGPGCDCFQPVQLKTGASGATSSPSASSTKPASRTKPAALQTRAAAPAYTIKPRAVQNCPGNNCGSMQRRGLFGRAK